MFNQRLEELIESLTTVESRYFKQYLAKYSNQNNQSKYAQLFDTIRKGKKRLKVVFDNNIQTRLYQYILESLRVKHAKGSNRIQIYQYLIDYENLLNKGLFNQAWKRLVKAEKIALFEEDYHLLEAIFEKQEYLVQVRIRHNKNASELLTISQKKDELEMLMEYLIRIDHFHADTYKIFKKDGRISRNSSRLKSLIKEGEQLIEQLPRFQMSKKAHQVCHEIARCNMMAGKLNRALEALAPLTQLYAVRPELKSSHSRGYAKFLNQKIIILNVLGRFDETKQCLKELDNLNRHAIEDSELQLLIFESTKFQELEMLLHMGEFQLGIHKIRNFLPELEQLKDKMHNVNVQSKYYRVALAYFGNKEFSKASKWINRNLQYEGVKYRHDVQASIEVLNLLNQYELGNYKLLGYLLPTTKKRLQSLDHWGKGEELLLELLSKLKDCQFFEVEKHILHFAEQFEQLKKIDHIYDHYPLIYFNLKFWYERKLKK